MSNPKSKRILINLAIVFTLIVGTLIGIQFAKGYRPNIENGSIEGNGLLSITSYPKSARVFINGKLTTLTDDKLYLSPTNYQIKIEKDGFHPWNKNVPLKPELVSSIDARLFPIIPATTPITFYQASNVSISPDGTKIAYVVSKSPIPADDGLYIYSLSNNLLGSQNTQITGSEKDYTKALLVWAPDNNQILAIFTEKLKSGEKISSSHLLSTKSMNQIKTLTDATLKLPQIIAEWQDKHAKINQPTLSLYPKYMVDVLTGKSINVYFSPDKERVFYTPTENLALPENAVGKALPNINSAQESRDILKGSTYVYDLKEGTNYQITLASPSSEIVKNLITTQSATPSASLLAIKQLKAQTESRYSTNTSWYGNRHLIQTTKDGVYITEYDNLNPTLISQATIKENFIAPSPDASKLLLLTNINQKPEAFNLISLDLK